MSFDPFAVICSGHALTPASLGTLGLVTALFVAGFTGSLAHCGPMCGPLVIAQVGNRLANVPAARLCERSRLRSGLLLPYHLGRLTTYAGLGAAVAVIGQGLSGLPWFRFVSAALLIVAACLFLWQAVAPSTQGAANTSASLWSRLVAGIAGKITGPGFLNGYGLGLLLGFIPCGLVYAALAAAAASADPLTGAIGMLAFGLGTVPMLVGIGLVGQVATLRMKAFASKLRPIVMTLNACLLLFLAATWAVT